MVSILLRIALPSLLGLWSVLGPKWRTIGVQRTVEPLPYAFDERCQTIPLEACEDVWASEKAGYAYLACSDHQSRAHWTPAVLHLSASLLPPISRDALHLVSLSSSSYQSSQIKLTNLPSDWPGLYTHGLDVYEHPGSSKITVFAISHRPPLDRSTSKLVGADSVVEIFEGKMGGKELKWQRTVRDDKIRTPNNIQAMGPDSFYVTNDHAQKVDFKRTFEALYAEGTDIVYCSKEGCIVAVDGLLYPNGIVKGPRNILFAGSSIGAYILSFNILPNNTLSHREIIDVGRIIDNIHYEPSTDELYVATIPKMLPFIKHSASPGKNLASPIEAYKITFASGDHALEREAGKPSLVFHNGDAGRHNVTRVLHSDGGLLSGMTSAAPIGGGKLMLTGLATSVVSVCPMI